MAMPLAPEPSWTLEQVRALPDDGRRYELVHGQLVVSPAPAKPHQMVAGDLYFLLKAWLTANPVGTVLYSPADLTDGPDVLVQPDLFVLTPEAAAAPGWNTLRECLLVIEVVSPSTAHVDRGPKRRIYQAAGGPFYWIVDPDARQVEVWTPTDTAPRLEATRLAWHPAGAAEPCVIELAALFA